MKPGAYIMKFYRFDLQEYVIVDDILPMRNDELDLKFADTLDRKELWPSILEKGYAKFHGNYSMIESGFMHICLSELTGGDPLMLKIDEAFYNNKQFYWNKLLLWHSQRYYLGAGSPERGSGSN